MNEQTWDIIKQVNQELSDLVDLPYTDFYKPERFVALFELPIENSELGTISYAMRIYSYNDFFNRISFLKSLCKYIDSCKDKKVINAIRREFKGLGE